MKNRQSANNVIRKDFLYHFSAWVKDKGIYPLIAVSALFPLLCHVLFWLDNMFIILLNCGFHDMLKKSINKNAVEKFTRVEIINKIILFWIKSEFLYLCDSSDLCTILNFENILAVK